MDYWNGGILEWWTSSKSLIKDIKRLTPFYFIYNDNDIIKIIIAACSIHCMQYSQLVVRLLANIAPRGPTPRFCSLFIRIRFLTLMNAVNLRSPQDFIAFLCHCITGSIYFTRHYNVATRQSNCISLWKMLNNYVRIQRIFIPFIAHGMYAYHVLAYCVQQE